MQKVKYRSGRPAFHFYSPSILQLLPLCIFCGLPLLNSRCSCYKMVKHAASRSHQNYISSYSWPGLRYLFPFRLCQPHSLLHLFPELLYTISKEQITPDLHHHSLLKYLLQEREGKSGTLACGTRIPRLLAILLQL